MLAYFLTYYTVVFFFCRRLLPPKRKNLSFIKQVRVGGFLFNNVKLFGIGVPAP